MTVIHDFDANRLQILQVSLCFQCEVKCHICEMVFFKIYLPFTFLNLINFTCAFEYVVFSLFCLIDKQTVQYIASNLLRQNWRISIEAIIRTEISRVLCRVKLVDTSDNKRIYIISLKITNTPPKSGAGKKLFLVHSSV